MRACPFGLLALLLLAFPVAVLAESGAALSLQATDASAQHAVRQETGQQPSHDAVQGSPGDGTSPAVPVPASPHQAVEERDCS